MRLNIPIYINQRGGSKTKGPPVIARPLFFRQPEKTGTELGRVIASLSDLLRVKLSDVGRSNSHDGLLRWHETRPISHRLTKLNLDLRDSTAAIKLLLVSVERFDRQLAFSPSLPDLWFDILPGEDLVDRATEVYEAYFRELRRDVPEYPVISHSIEGKAWIDHLAINVTPGSEPKAPADPLRAFLGGDDVSDGAAELRKTSRCLNWIDIDELAQPTGVDEDVRRLSQLLDVGDRRGVVLVGPSGSGKTARVEGVARLRRERKRSSTHGLLWHLTPARLISGMSYLGQWQERVLGILKHAHRYDHVLYLSDFLGLYEAGKTRDSVMCVADTLRAQLDVRPVRILAEMTNEAWAILREKDRALANRFVVMPTEALDVDKSMEIMIGVRQTLEAKRPDRRFDFEVLPEVLSMYDRFERSTVLPGKAIAAMHRLAARGSEPVIMRDEAISEFRSRSGLSSSIIDRRTHLTREKIRRRIRSQVVGQDGPVDALVDRVMVAAARMNDTSRPIGTYLLVGPTGVGKTQLAKAVSSCLFTDGGLIRLDMNELSSPASASRIIGTFDAPDGLLTSAVRRRPNAVLLLDEIEKAHPAVLDVLLQALGEARLSDARGRMVDLSGLLILMTSNLGARQSTRSSGFVDAGNADKIRQNHMKAVKEFFRPEFFNRIDDVLCFERLSSDAMEDIAAMQFHEILQRDGLQRRSVLIDIDPEAIKRTATRGYDPAMGARALKRQIERDLIGPAAKVLAGSSSNQPALLRLRCDDDQVVSDWQPVEYVQANQTRVISNEQLCDCGERWLDEIQDRIHSGPLSFEVNGKGVDPTLLETMTLRDSFSDCEQAIGKLRDLLRRPKLQRPQSSPVTAPRMEFRFDTGARVDFRQLHAIDDIQDYLKESLVVTKPSDLDPIRDSLINHLGRLHAQLNHQDTAARWMVWTRWYGERFRPKEGSDLIAEVFEYTDRDVLTAALEQWGKEEESLMVQDLKIPKHDVFEYSGALASSSIDEFCGTWMFVNNRGRIALADIRKHELNDDEPVQTQFDRWQSESVCDRIAPVRRVIQSDRPMIDLMTGAAAGSQESTQKMSAVQSIIRLLRKSRQSLDFLDPYCDRDTPTQADEFPIDGASQ